MAKYVPPVEEVAQNANSKPRTRQLVSVGVFGGLKVPTPPPNPSGPKKGTLPLGPQQVPIFAKKHLFLLPISNFEPEQNSASGRTAVFEVWIHKCALRGVRWPGHAHFGPHCGQGSGPTLLGMVMTELLFAARSTCSW